MHIIKFSSFSALNSADLFEIVCSSVHYQQDIVELFKYVTFYKLFQYTLINSCNEKQLKIITDWAFLTK